MRYLIEELRYDRNQNEDAKVDVPCCGGVAPTWRSQCCIHVNLFELIIGHLKARGFYAKALDMQHKQGDAALLKVLAAPLVSGEKLSTFYLPNRTRKNAILQVPLKRRP